MSLGQYTQCFERMCQCVDVANKFIVIFSETLVINHEKIQ